MQPSEKVALTAVSGQDTGANRCQRDARQSRKAVGGMRRCCSNQKLPGIVAPKVRSQQKLWLVLGTKQIVNKISRQCSHIFLYLSPSLSLCPFLASPFDCLTAGQHTKDVKFVANYSCVTKT